jgi:hypothetical protein
MKFRFIIISFFCSLNVYSQLPIFDTDISFQEKQADSLDIKMDSVMILGVGSSVTRLFLIDLTDKIKRELNKQDITVSYFYLGKTTEEAKKEFTQLSKQGYKVLLFLLPESSDYFQIENYTSTSGAGGINITTTSTSMSYFQTFKFQLFKNGFKNDRIWYASVSVDCDPSKKYGSKQVAKKLLTRFRKNKYIH